MAETSRNIVIVDYEMSNLFSVKHACEHVGGRVTISSDPAEVAAADGLILPGVGAFKDAMANLHRLDLVSPITDAIDAGKPFLGVCLGLQLLFEGSDEFGGAEGLGVVPGRVVRFPDTAPDGSPLKVPHIGWNTAAPAPEASVSWNKSPCRDVQPGEHFYFVHSYHVVPDHPEDAFTITDYKGLTFCSSVARANIFATQFHPEKSGEEGLKIYRNWIRISTDQGE